MKIYTAHLRGSAPPVLVREGFALGALLFGPLWLLANGAWIAALVLLALESVAGLAGPPVGPLLMLGLALLNGWYGRDLVRWHLARRGYLLAHVVAARNEDAAYARLMDARPDLVAAAAG